MNPKQKTVGVSPKVPAQAIATVIVFIAARFGLAQAEPEVFREGQRLLRNPLGATYQVACPAHRSSDSLTSNHLEVKLRRA